MLLVIADDFSGAAEMAGIAHRYGLTTEVQFEFQQCKSDVIVISADTREGSREEAVKKTRHLAKSIKASGIKPHIFKKVDSVLRGFIADEINVLSEMMGYRRALLLPANPARGRIILDGNYLVNGTPLHESVFARDPSFPARTSEIKEIMASKDALLPHNHLARNQKLLSSGLLTGDIQSSEDIKDFVSQLSVSDLCSGGAECFQAFIEVFRYNKLIPKAFSDVLSTKKYRLILNGSTVRNEPDSNLINKYSVPVKSVPGQWKEGEFIFGTGETVSWQLDVMTTLQKEKIVCVSIDHPVKQSKATSSIFNSQFIGLVRYLSGHMSLHEIHIGLTGGATATELIRETSKGSLMVEQELATGVVTLTDSLRRHFFTVKPGSYYWPEAMLERKTQ